MSNPTRLSKFILYLGLFAANKQHMVSGFLSSGNVEILPVERTIKISTSNKHSLITTLNLLNNNDNQEDENPFKDFNPFEKKKVQNLNPIISSNNNISLRQLRMKEVMNTLLQNVSLEESLEEANTKQLQSILEENSELILEPLDDDHCVMDEDSIYEPGMTREERYGRYDDVMEKRIDKAANKSVKRILSVMREYVSSQK